MKRYTYDCGCCALTDNCGSEMREDPDGCYILFKDAGVVEAKIKGERDFIASEYATYLEHDPSHRPKEDTTVAELLEEAKQGIHIKRN